ncbi:MAG: OmpA family protein [Mycobacterium sp.]|nr:OmpA family protein [Mycobacterium sp.]
MPAQTVRIAQLVAGLMFTLTLLLATLTGCAASSSPSVTIVVTASAAEPAPSLDKPIAQALTNRALATLSPGGGAVDIVVAGRPDVVTVDLTPTRKTTAGTEVETKPETAQRLVASHLDELTATLASITPGIGELDLLTVYDRGLRHTENGGTVIVQSSGVQTRSPLDLNALGWSFDPQVVVADLKAKNLIPDATGKRVAMYGIGVALGSQPPLARPQRQLLQQLWREICMAGGAASCEVADTDTSMTLPVSTLPVSIVAVPALGTPQSACTASALSIPDTVLFAADSPALRPGADDVLARLATELSTCPTGAQVHIIGHTADVDPHHVDGQDLSDQRAFVCRDRLIAHGVPPSLFTEVRGVADTQPRVADIVDGVFQETLAVLNRRVDVYVDVTQ